MITKGLKTPGRNTTASLPESSHWSLCKYRVKTYCNCCWYSTSCAGVSNRWRNVPFTFTVGKTLHDLQQPERRDLMARHSLSSSQATTSIRTERDKLMNTFYLFSFSCLHNSVIKAMILLFPDFVQEAYFPEFTPGQV